MNHILDIEKQEQELHKVFEKIAEGNTVLFLGAGASVGEKRYLSREVIQYYESYLGKDYNESNITKFVDILSADPDFNRDHFNAEVVKMLEKYKITEGHKIAASLPWREIITTNYDLLIENAFDQLKSTSNHLFNLKIIREQNEYNYRVSNSEIKYVKLNGCMSDKRKYPLAFSTDDFNNLNSFYKVVLNDLKNLSDNISLLSVGYSFSDDFGVQLLEKYDSYNYRNRKWILNIDPYPNESALHYYTSKRICIIKLSFQDFFLKYHQWDDARHGSTVRKRKITFTNSKNSQIAIPNKLAVDLSNVIKQLSENTKEHYIKDADFYKGEEPNYNVITRDVDVVKNNMISDAIQIIEKNINGTHDPLIPIFFLKGDFGIGKSTFTLRLINELSKRSEMELVAFEILDFLKLRKEYLVDLFGYCNAKNIVLYCDEVEIESTFKALIELRRELSIEQFNDFRVLFLVPVRENILERYKLDKEFKRSYEIELSGALSDTESDELLSKLKNAGLISFRDAAEKRKIQHKIKSEYDNDSFISLLQLVTNGNHVNDLLSAYNELSEDAQKAFLFTALLHQFKIMMPANWLREIISLDWEKFTERVIKAEGRGILIQKYIDSYGTEPDIFFRTKHPIIASELVKKIISSKDKQFKMFEKMFNTVDIGSTGAYLVNNILKNFVRTEYYSTSKINKLYDHAYLKLNEDPHYLLNYAINLQSRGTLASLKKGLDILIYAESLLKKRNHRFIHRRAVINFDLAKLYFEEEGTTLNFTRLYLEEAKSLLNVKQLLDPFSAYSYVDYIKLLIWEIQKIRFEEEEEISYRIRIEELFELAENAVTEDINRILNLKTQYANYLESTINSVEYKEYLDDLYAKVETRPYACILLYKYYEDNHESNGDWQYKCSEYINEMHEYTDNNEVVKYLIKHYGRRLYEPNNRIKFFRLCRNHPFIENEIPLRYYYFNFIAESYDRNFHDGREALKQINGKFHGLNPVFHYVWSDPNGNELEFNATITTWFSTRFKAIKVNSLGQVFSLIKGDYNEIPIGKEVKVKLHFYLYGIKAEILQSSI